ncbi:MAG: hypothetical protein AB8H79_18695 [Myxococcota bacterium]
MPMLKYGMLNANKRDDAATATQAPEAPAKSYLQQMTEAIGAGNAMVNDWVGSRTEQAAPTDEAALAEESGPSILEQLQSAANGAWQAGEESVADVQTGVSGLVGSARDWWGAQTEGPTDKAGKEEDPVQVDGTAVESTSLSAGGAYVDQIDRYGFGQDTKLTENGGSARGDMTQIWCSGLSTATLMDMGIDVDAAIDGQSFRERGRDKDLTIRHLIEGMTEPLATTDAHAATIAAVPRGEDSYSDYLGRRADAGYGAEGLFGATPAEDDLRVKGAAGAFVLAGIGTEIAAPTQTRPGDFVQAREVGGKDGHAFQVHSVVAEGSAIFGLPGSPELISAMDEGRDVGGGTQHDFAQFRITQSTNPDTVLSAQAKDWSVLESNVAGAFSGQQRLDNPNGGVVVREDQPIPTFETMDADQKRYYIGRLSSSVWSAAGPEVAP